MLQKRRAFNEDTFVSCLKDHTVVSHPIPKQYRGYQKETTLNHVLVGSSHKNHIDVMDVKNKYDINVTFEVIIETCGYHSRMSDPRRY